jgi:hypothetical protein
MSFQIQYTSIIIRCFVTKMQTFFSFGLFFYVFFLSNYFSLISFTFSLSKFSFSFFCSPLFSFIIYYNQLFLLVFYFFIFIIFFIEHAYFMPDIWVYYTNHPKKPKGILCFKCEYCKIILTKLMFILRPLCKYFTLNFMF